ncbi:putative glycerol-1-phosphate prenyltransferase [Peribacillus deserti]|uniref:Heptaprenylglyceryl phosphate synthase n=1 Tax=Peribacillus deserti TaxID=673318 RepID=A0ABS2QHS5_9BACI|nr:heptaprenylglyceryl phosphate synthase [Peribacillus deserti]MBM7692692.1 putative glycerol-1-phosphate prenyltransferase [Peribacillus deserti]
MYDYRMWKHVFKLDPYKELSDDQLERICESGTDAILIGGSDGVTLENVLDLMSRVRRYTVPCVLEVSGVDTVTPGFDLYFIPTVLNSRNPDWIVNLHHQAVREYGEIMDWDEIHVEGYCILNSNCKAAKLTEANADLTEDDVMAYAMMAEKMFNLPIFYLENSGEYASPALVQKVKSRLDETVLFYGGGIKTAEQAREMALLADVVVVGNAVYDDLEDALLTVKAAKSSI